MTIKIEHFVHLINHEMCLNGPDGIGVVNLLYPLYAGVGFAHASESARPQACV